MSPKHAVPRLDMSSFRISAFRYDFSSPYPPTSPSIDSSDEEDVPPTSKTTLRSSIAELPDFMLRSIMVKLVDTNPRFQRAIMKEVACARMTGDSPPSSATSSPKTRKSRARHRSKTLEERPIQLPTSPLMPATHDELVYHPGHLLDEVYEFLPQTPDKAAFSVMRTIKMWSCCDEDEWSAGCRLSASHVRHLEQNPSIVELSQRDVFPDSDLERQGEDIAHEARTRPNDDEPTSYYHHLGNPRSH